MEHYDYLVVGAGLYGSILAYRAHKEGKKVLVIDKRAHVGGNLYCEGIDGTTGLPTTDEGPNTIQVHKYGPHIFHTSNKEVWDFVNSLVPFNHFRYCPLAYYKGNLYHMPFNMNTFYELWGTKTPAEAKAMIEKQRNEITCEPKNLEEQAISLVGREVYEKLVKCYTEKQWGRDCKDLPPFIIKRLPVRYCYNNNYFNDCYQGIPVGGYNKIFDKLLEGIEVRVNTNFFDNREEFEKLADRIIYSGPLDEYFGFKYGNLEYRSLRFEEELHDMESYQGNIAVNYTDHDHPYTRIVEHKYFEFGTQPMTVITKEYSQEWKPGMEPYYPVNDEKNSATFTKYWTEAENLKNVMFCGRLAEYKYYDMHKIVELALAKEI